MLVFISTFVVLFLCLRVFLTTRLKEKLQLVGGCYWYLFNEKLFCNKIWKIWQRIIDLYFWHKYPCVDERDCYWFRCNCSHLTIVTSHFLESVATFAWLSFFTRRMTHSSLSARVLSLTHLLQHWSSTTLEWTPPLSDKRYMDQKILYPFLESQFVMHVATNSSNEFKLIYSINIPHEFSIAHVLMFTLLSCWKNWKVLWWHVRSLLLHLAGFKLFSPLQRIYLRSVICISMQTFFADWSSR